jgi:hypothetical protein
MSTENKNLYYLHELQDYKVAANYPDIRGWKVFDRDNRVLGKVDGLLVNKYAERVVYLDVEVDEAMLKDAFDTFKLSTGAGAHGFINSEGEDHIIIPIGMVRLDEEEKKAVTPDLDYDTFSTTKWFSKDSDITRQYDLEIFNSYVPELRTEGRSRDKSDIDNSDVFLNRKETTGL